MAAEGQKGGNQIARLQKGKSDRTARHADVMNEIIDALNKLIMLTVKPDGAGKLMMADGNAVLQLTGAAACAPSQPPGSGTWIWGSVDGVCQWIETTNCT